MSDGSPDWPTVSAVLPAVDEADHLADAVRAILEQDYPGPLEVVVAVGPSSDDTARVAARLAAQDARVVVVDNPAGRTPAGLNRAIEAASGEVVARVDGHAVISDGYLRRAVRTLHRTGAGNVGGIQRAVGTGPTQRAVAAAMSSRFGVGDARFHHGGPAGPVDTVYLGVFRRDALADVGGFDESLVRNQDYELNWRLRQAGWTVWFDPELVVDYAPRSTLRALADQYHQYGRWKRLVVRRDPRSLRWRQLVAPATVLANVAGLTVGLTMWRPALVAPATYLAGTVVATAAATGVSRDARVRLPLAFLVMHHAWGLGFLRGVGSPAASTIGPPIAPTPDDGPGGPAERTGTE